MGEVWSATDTNLGRQVAIKVLPEAFASDAERLARFEREAKTLGSLNHPNIAAIYGLERSGPIRALVMELVEGPTLAERIAHGAIPIEEALPMAKQIAEALEAAHEQGIIHRDLKPANVKVREDGTIKVLDFGLAKITGTAAVVLSGNSMSPTITTPAMTQAGIILGTAAYMSPEQAKGRPADKRSDVWAFGCVLFEMVSGYRAFDGEDTVDVLGAVARLEPDWSCLPSSVPPLVHALLQSCLVKNRKERLGDFAGALFVLRTAPTMPATHIPVSTAVSTWKRALPLAAAVVVGALIAAAMAVSLWPRTTAAVSRFMLELSALRPGIGPTRGAVAVSPDGRRYAVVTTQGLYIRERNALESRLVHTASVPINWVTFSPDGESVAFYEGGQLKRIDVTSGASITIAQVSSNLLGMSWNDEDTILFGQPQGIMRVAANGGMPELLIASRARELVFGPQMMPDGRTVIYSVAPDGQSSAGQVVAHRLDSSERVVLVNRGIGATYLSTGHLLYASGGQVFAAAFDPATLTVQGRPQAVLQSVLQDPVTGSASYAVARDGTLIYVDGSTQQQSATNTMVWVDRQRHEVPIAAPERLYTYPRLSADGSQISVSVGAQLWVYSIRRGTLERVSTNSDRAVAAEWSRSGNDLVFYADGGEGGPGLLRRTASLPIERIANGHYVPLSWSKDGGQLVVLDFGANLPGTPPPDADLGIIALGAGAQTARPFMRTPAQEDSADVSPDGRWIALETNESGQQEVYVRPFADPNRGRWQISLSGGLDPVWSSDGRALFYRVGNSIMEVAVTGDDPAEWGRPVKLFEGEYLFSGGPRYFDVAPDGRFLMLKPTANTATLQPNVVVVLNWAEELKRLAPTN